VNGPSSVEAHSEQSPARAPGACAPVRPAIYQRQRRNLIGDRVRPQRPGRLRIGPPTYAGCGPLREGIALFNPRRQSAARPASRSAAEAAGLLLLVRLTGDASGGAGGRSLTAALLCPVDASLNP
jgi:hypothetical protein